MAENSATLDQSGQVSGPRDAQANGPAPRAKSDAMRFIYATGDRPLQGYTIKRGIGIGGFGQVYYAVSDAGKEVALKHIQRNLDVELRGVSACLNLKHPNLLALYDIRYDEAGEGWVVMEYITGESLRDVLDRNPNGMPHDEIGRWLAGMAAGVACLHDNGIVHRDLKPGNVFSDVGIIKIGDYGLSKFISVSRKSAQTESVGTFHYMAPEIGRGRYGREIDIYALGIILYEMLTGDVPFDGESSQEIIMKHLTAEPKLDGLPQPYREVIAQALVKDPQKRLGSVPEMLRLLNIALPNAGASPVIAMAPAVPPVRNSSRHPSSQTPTEETLYIDEESAEKDEIEFGPVEHHVQSTGLPVNKSNQQPRAMVVSLETAGAARPNRTYGHTAPVSKPPDEPIARAIYLGWQGMTAWFSNPAASTPLKALAIMAMAGGGAFALFVMPWIFVPAVLGLGLLYAFYYAVRAIVISLQSEEDDRESRGLAEDATGLRRWQQRARLERATRPRLAQMSELTGALIVSAAVAGVLAVVTMILAGKSMGGAVVGWGPQLAWFSLAAVAGAWGVLIPGNFFAARDGDQIMRRLTMLGVGLGVGLLAWGVASGLMLEMNYGNLIANRSIPASLYDSATKQPTLPAYLAYFGGLFFILRWWLQADPLRAARFSLWATVLCAVWGLVMPFPQPWGILLATTISIAVQLAAPWVNKPERNRIRQQFRLQDAQGVRRA